MSEIPLQNPNDYINAFEKRHHVNSDDMRVFLFDVLDMIVEEDMPEHVERARFVGELLMRLETNNG